MLAIQRYTRHPELTMKELNMRAQKIVELLEQLEESTPVGIFQDFIYHFPGYIAIYDDKNQGIAFSKKFCNLLGYEEKDLLKDAWKRLVVKEDLKSTLIAAQRGSCVPLLNFVNHWKTNDGKYVKLCWSCEPWNVLGEGDYYVICLIEHLEES